MTRVIKICIEAISYFFNFRKPAFRKFNCIDIVAGNKLLFLMAWDAVNAGCIVVNPGQHVYRKTAGALIITLLPATTSVQIYIRNCWRRALITVPLKQVSLDKESCEWLTRDLHLFTGLAIADMQPERYSVLPHLKLERPILQEFYCQTNINPQFNYQNLDQYGP